MKMFKISSILLLSFLFMWVSIPQLSAKHSRRTSWSFNLNVNPTPVCYQYNYCARPAYYQRTTVIQPYRPYYEECTYYPAYSSAVYARSYPAPV